MRLSKLLPIGAAACEAATQASSTALAASNLVIRAISILHQIGMRSARLSLMAPGDESKDLARKLAVFGHAPAKLGKATAVNRERRGV
jgi:hypothetical protein